MPRADDEQRSQTLLQNTASSARCWAGKQRVIAIVVVAMFTIAAFCYVISIVISHAPPAPPPPATPPQEPAETPFKYWAPPMAPNHSTDVTRSVLVARHCVRAASATVKAGQAGMTQLEDYTSHGPISYPVPAYMCVPRGLVLIKGLAWNLKPALPQPVAVRYDDGASRDRDTAAAFLQGLGINGSGIPDGALFKPTYNSGTQRGIPGCMPVESSRAEQLLRARWAEFPYYCRTWPTPGQPCTPSSDTNISHRDVMVRVQELLGRGAAANISGYASPPGTDPAADHVSADRYLVGGSAVASAFIEAWLLEQGTATARGAVAWGQLAASGEDGPGGELGLHKL
jgi:hypothetical protein